MTRIGVRGALPLVLLGALTASPASARADDGLSSPAPICAHLRLVDDDPDARALLGEIGDVLSEDLPRLDMARAPASDVSRLFRADDPDAACVTAWVIIEASRARIRVASAGRCRYVFRELDLEHPLSELDRERVGQVAKAAMSAVAVSDEAQTCAAAPVVVSPIAQPPPTPQAPPQVTAQGSLERSVPWPELAVGASYGGTYHSGAFRHGPGVSVVATESSWLYEPELWVELRYVFAGADQSVSLGADTQALAGRIGVSARWWPLVRYGLGVGVDREVMAVEPPGFAGSPGYDYVSWNPAARAFARIASPSYNKLSLSVTVLIDVVKSPDPVNSVRGGLVIEGWWHS